MWCILPGLALTPTDFEPLKQHLAASLPVGDPGSAREHTVDSWYGQAAGKMYEHSAHLLTQHKPNSFPEEPSVRINEHSSSFLLEGVDIRILDSWKVPVTGPVDAIRRHLLADGDVNQPVNLIGHSVGGLAALEWALRFPNQVHRLVLLDPTAPQPSPAFWRLILHGSKHVDCPPTQVRPLPESRRHQARSAHGWRGSNGQTPIGLGAELSARVASGTHALVQPVISLAARFAPDARALLFQRSATPNRLTPLQAQRRYGSPRALAKMAEQFLQSWRQQDRVADMFDALHRRDGSTLAAASNLQILQVVGVGPHDQAFVHQQRRLAESLGSELHLLFHTNHLFPVSQPKLVAMLISRWLRR